MGEVLVGLVQWHSTWDVYSTRMMVLLLTVPHQHFNRHFLRWTARHQLGRHLAPFGFISPVLEPDFNLGLGELQCSGQIGALGPGQVPLRVEAALQLVYLRVREGRPGALLGPGPGLQRASGSLRIISLLSGLFLTALSPICGKERSPEEQRGLM